MAGSLRRDGLGGGGRGAHTAARSGFRSAAGGHERRAGGVPLLPGGGPVQVRTCLAYSGSWLVYVKAHRTRAQHLMWKSVEKQTVRLIGCFIGG